MKVAIISTSLAEKSRSRIAAQFAKDELEKIGNIEVTMLDIADTPLGMYSSGEEDKNITIAKDALKEADAWIIAAPVHNWGPAASTVNFLTYALDKKTSSYKPFVILGGAGTITSFLAMDGLQRMIMTEVKGIAVGPAILCAGDSVDRDTKTIDEKLQARITERLSVLVKCINV